MSSDIQTNYNIPFLGSNILFNKREILDFFNFSNNILTYKKKDEAINNCAVYFIDNE